MGGGGVGGRAVVVHWRSYCTYDTELRTTGGKESTFSLIFCVNIKYALSKVSACLPFMKTTLSV